MELGEGGRRYRESDSSLQDNVLYCIGRGGAYGVGQFMNDFVGVTMG
jgi:hypothetical protein